MAEQPSPPDVKAFDRRVTALLNKAATAERAELASVLDEIQAAQLDIRDLAGFGDVFGVQVTKVQRRLATLEKTVLRLVDDAVPSAVARGVTLVDAGLDAAGIAVRSRFVSDVATGPLEALRAGIRKHLSDLQARTVYELSKMTGPTPVGVDVVLRSIGTKLRGSAVFGGPASHTAGVMRATLGDITGAATRERAAQLAEGDGPRTLKRWVHSSTVDEPRESHITAGQRYAAGIPWDQKFEIGSYRTDRPRGPGLPGVHRFGCRCQLAPVLSTEE